METTPVKRGWLFKILGLRRRPGKKIAIAPTKWGWLLIVLVLGGGGMAAFAEYSMQPDFCRSCHLMEPYYQAWHNSTHKGVLCVDCHFEPGLANTFKGKWQASSQAVKYVTQTYGSKPHAEIKDVSCMRSGCHEKRLLEGKVNWEVPTADGRKITIRFDHTPHLNQERRGQQLRCVSCHSQIVQGQHLVVTLDTCFLCHMKGFEHGRNDKTLGGCRSCHDAPKEQIRLATGMFNHQDYLGRGVTCENCHSDVVKGDGAVPRQVCWTCHNQESQVRRFGETSFLHEQHVTAHKVECQSCHIQIEHNLNAAAQHVARETGSCASCHSKMHGGPDELYQGIGARGVPDMPSPMYRAQVDCIACHKAKKEPDGSAQVIGQTFVAVQESCNYCHGSKYDTVLDTWKRMIDHQVETTQAAYDRAALAMSGWNGSGPEKLRAQRLLDDAEHNLRFVKLGHGVHNVNYATAALNVAADNSKEVLRIAQGGP